VDPIALGMIALAAVLHASWNILLKTSDDRVGVAAAGMTVGSVVLVPIALVAWLAMGRPEVPLSAWVVGLLSGVVETAYFLSLSEAYRRADLSVVYPVARGTAPLLSVLVGVLVLGERLAPVGWAGVALLLAGLLVVQRPWRFLRSSGHAHRGGVAFALLTGATIAGYSSLDRVGVQLAPVWAYAAIIWPATAIGLLLALAVRGRLVGRRPPGSVASDGSGGLLAMSPPSGPPRVSFLGRPAIVGGALMGATYGLVLAALARAPLVIIAPLRESAVVLGSLWGIVRLGEAADRREVGIRIAGALLVLGGAVVLALGR
jgi:multidrug transporter EmrE-like cation transporter